MIVRDQDPYQLRTLHLSIRAVLSGLTLLLVGVCITLPTAAGAADRAPLVLTGPAEIEALGPHLDYITDPAWQLGVNDVVGPSPVAMQPIPGPIPDFGYTTARIWLRLDVLNGTTAQSDWRFFVHVGFLQQLAVFRVGSDGTVTTLIDLTEQSPFRARPIDYPQVVAPFSLQPGEAATVVVMYQSLGAARHTMSIETPESFAAKAGTTTAKNFAFYGMILVMVALACVALVTLRQRVFAIYGAYLSFILVYIAHADGTAFQYLWPSFPELNTMAAAVTGSGVMVFGGLFAITFLQTARYHPIMHRVLIVVVGSVLLVDLVLWIADPKLLNRVLVYMILVSVLTFVAAGLAAARTRFREVRFYLLSWTASLVPAVLFTARFAFGYAPAVVTPFDAIRLALVLDALMMGLAIFDRYNHLRQAAAEETLAHARHNLALSHRLASLEESYEQVTTIARQRAESVKDTVHDLRQPMQALRLSLRQMLNPEARGNTDIAQVETALGYMEKLVADRLASDPRAASVEVPATDEPRLHAVLQGVTDMFAAEAAAKGLTLRLVLASADAGVSAYPLMRVAANLVSNAIKYTGEGRILIALRSEGSGKRVEIHDTGPGLNGAAFERALLRKERLERDRDRAAGSGLGLAVVKEIAEANGWRLTSCASRTTGASIRLHLPADGGSGEPLRRAEGRADIQVIA